MNTIDERRSKIVRNRVFDWQSKTQFLRIYDPHSSIVKSVFDCHLVGVFTKTSIIQKVEF